MKTVLRSLLGICMACGAAWATPPDTLVDEDFEGAGFPPTGWRVYVYGNATADWVWGGGEANHYAYGYANGGHNYWSAADLATPNQTLYAGDYLNVSFDYAGSWVGTLSGYAQRFFVDKGGSVVWSRSMSLGGWTTYNEKFGPVGAGGADYDFRWDVYASGPSSMGPGGTAYFSVDDITITRDGLAVGPASLGQIKARYR